jgi:hypothetical protein
MNSTQTTSRWEWAWIVPLSLVLSGAITATFVVVIYMLQ